MAKPGKKPKSIYYDRTYSATQKPTIKSKAKLRLVEQVAAPVKASTILLAIRSFFESASPQETQHLWLVLSGLRGPDNDQSPAPLKAATTGVIRQAVLGPSRGYLYNDMISYGPDHPDLVNCRMAYVKMDTNNGVDHHFITHAEKAFDMLGLKWAELND